MDPIFASRPIFSNRTAAYERTSSDRKRTKNREPIFEWVQINRTGARVHMAPILCAENRLPIFLRKSGPDFRMCVHMHPSSVKKTSAPVKNQRTNWIDLFKNREAFFTSFQSIFVVFEFCDQIGASVTFNYGLFDQRLMYWSLLKIWLILFSILFIWDSPLIFKKQEKVQKIYYFMTLLLKSNNIS